jgi:hypothetical protein
MMYWGQIRALILGGGGGENSVTTMKRGFSGTEGVGFRSSQNTLVCNNDGESWGGFVG